MVNPWELLLLLLIEFCCSSVVTCLWFGNIVRCIQLQRIQSFTLVTFNWPDPTRQLMDPTRPDPPQTKLEKVALDGSVECCAPPPRWCDLELWPFDPKNAISSSLSPDTPVTEVWRKSVDRYWRYRGNKTTTWITDRRTHGRTDGQQHGQTTRKHIAFAGLKSETQPNPTRSYS